MIFTSFEFAAFFTLVLLLRASFTSHDKEKWFLLAASYLFYMSWSVPCVLLILFTSSVDYFVGLAMSRTEQGKRRKALLLMSLILNLGLLAYFKYTNFFLESAGGTLRFLGLNVSHWRFDILLPAGISFFTFQSMSYTIDVYRREIEPSRSLRDFLLFVAFFPQLLAGPIVRASSLLPQLVNRVRGTAKDFEVGLALFGIGAVKKLVLSDQIAGHVDTVFAHPENFAAITLLQGVLGYAVQIYCDFSGYSDMAIGCARIMGYRFPDNFRMPYSASTITEFWHRWHISLSTWLRDYLYIPLGGNRLGTGRTYLNLLLTMLLGGFWHGASWNFIIWGGIHGGALAIHKLWLGWRASNAQNRLGWPWHMASRAMTLVVILVGWLFFRAHDLSQAGGMLARMITWDETGARLISAPILGAIIVLLMAHLLVPKDSNWAEEIVGKSLPLRIVSYAAILLLIACMGATDAAPFIYFQF